eukprot:g1793.t1
MEGSPSDSSTAARPAAPGIRTAGHPSAKGARTMASAPSSERGSPSAAAARGRIDRDREANPRRAMSWRRGSPTAGGFSKDPRQRTGSMVDDRELLRRKALVLGASSSAARDGEDELVMLHFQDVREELELSGHNLTSVLNNPRETFMDSLYEAAFEAEPPLPDLEVVRANVPQGMREVTPQDVEPYIRRTGALTRAFQRNHAASAAAAGSQDSSGGRATGGSSGSAGNEGLSGRRASGSDLVVPGAEEAPRYGLGLRRFRTSGSTGNGDGGRAATPTAAAAAAAAAAASVANGGGGGGGGGKRGGGERDLGAGGSVSQCFDQVPGMFFDKGFTLQDPAVFEDAVMAAGAEQPERLAHYLDLVEVCLLKQISHRSDALFEGLKTSQDLQTHVTGACTTLYQLRESMRSMQEDVLAGPMRVPQLQRRRSNLMALESTLELVARVQQSQAAIEGLLAAEDYLGALDILQSAKATVKNDLGKLLSLKHVGRQLKEYEGLVSDLLSNRFVNLAVTIPVDIGGGGGGGAVADAHDSDLSWETPESLSGGGGGGDYHGDGSSGGASGGAAAGSNGGAGGEELRRDLELIVVGLLRLGEMERVVGVVQERVSEDLKLIIRTVVGDFLATTDDSGELMDTFHLFGDETTTTTAEDGKGDGAGREGSGDGGGGGEEGEEGSATAAAGGSGGGQSVAKLKTLDGEAFCSCLEMCFEHMLSVLTRVSQMHKALASIVDACQGSSSPPADSQREWVPQHRHQNGGRGGRGGEGREEGGRSTGRRGDADGSVEEGAGESSSAAAAVTAEEGAVIVERSRSCLRALSELMERSVSQLLSVRREHNCTKLDVDELKHLWDITVAFIQSVERLSGCNGYKLRSTLLSQAKAFVEARHEANKQTLVKRLDAEKWAQADVTPERQAVLDRLSNGQVFPDPSHKANGNGGKEGDGSGGGGFGNGAIRLPSEPPAQPNFVGGSRSGRKGGRGERRREAVVVGASFKTVGSALLVAEMSVNFLQFAAHFPAIATDVLTRLGDLLRVFNSRATQLVLGAGAIHSTAKLKSISAKHLALCSQSLGLVRAVIPLLKAALATRLPQKHHLLLAQMDAVAQDYRDHRDKIFSKFVSMIEELIEARSGSLKLTDWDTPGGRAGGGAAAAASAAESSGGGSGADGGGAAAGGDPCQFTADVRKAVTAMHNILQQQLPPEQLQAVFRRMFAVITRKVPACFEREGVSPSTAAGRQRILDDIGFACAALSTLRGVDSSTLGLEQAIAEIYGKGIDGGGGGSGGGRGSSQGSAAARA